MVGRGRKDEGELAADRQVDLEVHAADEEGDEREHDEMHDLQNVDKGELTSARAPSSERKEEDAPELPGPERGSSPRAWRAPRSA